MEKAATIQETHEQFNCRLIEIGVCSSTSAKVTVTGEENDVKRLFESIGE